MTNALFLVASVESLPEELCSIADHVTVHFPWGSLLRAVISPEVAALGNVAGICRPGASLEVVLSYDGVDSRAREGGFMGFGDDALARLAPGYAEARFRLESIEEFGAREAAQIETRWAKRLAYGRPRRFWRLRARRQ